MLKEKEFAVFSSLLGVSVFKVLNVSTLIFLFLIVLNNVQSYPKWFHVVLMFMMLVGDYFLYVHKGKHETIIKESLRLDKKKSRAKDFLVVFYMITTFAAFFIAVYEGRKLL